MAIGEAFRAARRLRVQFALIIALAMAPAGLLAVFQAAGNIEEAIQNEEAKLRKAARQVSEDERFAVVGIRERLRVTARDPDIKAMGGAECDETLARIISNDDRFSGALVFNQQGRSVCGSVKDFDISDAAAFRDFLEAPRVLVGPVRRGRLSGRNMMLALAPVLGEKGEAGILAMGIAADFFHQMTAEGTDQRIQFALLDETGAVFSGEQNQMQEWLPKDVASLLNDDEEIAAMEARDGSQRLYYVAPMPIDRFWMIAAQPKLSWSGILLSNNGLQLITPLLLWAIAVTAAFFVIDRLVSRHIVYLQRVAAAIGRGNLDMGRLQMKGAPFEIKRLGDALENMSTRLAEREAALKANIEAKRALLLEVHHRVKNNLQMISSLMNMQMRRSGGAGSDRSMQIVQDRIHGLALVHQHLYSADRLDAVALDRLVSDLATYLRRSLCPRDAEATLEFDLSLTDASADIATPVALFLTEAVSNAFKHSWAEGVHGTLSITLKRVGDDQFELSIYNDRPPGTAEIGETEDDGGLGARLMKGFAQQIGGSLTTEMTEDSYSVVLVAPRQPRSHSFEVRQHTRHRKAMPPEEQDPKIKIQG